MILAGAETTSASLYALNKSLVDVPIVAFGASHQTSQSVIGKALRMRLRTQTFVFSGSQSRCFGVKRSLSHRLWTRGVLR